MKTPTVAARRPSMRRSLLHRLDGLIVSSLSATRCADSATLAPQAVLVQLDVSGSESGIEAAVKTTWVAFSRIDALVNNAGIIDPKKQLSLVVLAVFDLRYSPRERNIGAYTR